MKILAGFSLGKNDLDFWNRMLFNNVWSTLDMECGRYTNFLRKRNFKESVSMKRGRDTKLSQEEEFQEKCKGKKI